MGGVLVTAESGSVAVRSKHGEIIQTVYKIGSIKGVDYGDFQWPHDVAVSEDLDIFVADMEGQRVVRLALDRNKTKRVPVPKVAQNPKEIDRLLRQAAFGGEKPFDLIKG